MSLRLIVADKFILFCFLVGITSFDRLGHGSFLKFITENKSLLRLLEFGTATSVDILGAKVTKEELIHFIIQCGNGRKKVRFVTGFHCCSLLVFFS